MNTNVISYPSTGQSDRHAVRRAYTRHGRQRVCINHRVRADVVLLDLCFSNVPPSFVIPSHAIQRQPVHFEISSISCGHQYAVSQTRADCHGPRSRTVADLRSQPKRNRRSVKRIEQDKKPSGKSQYDPSLLFLLMLPLVTGPQSVHRPKVRVQKGLCLILYAVYHQRTWRQVWLHTQSACFGERHVRQCSSQGQLLSLYPQGTCRHSVWSNRTRVSSSTSIFTTTAHLFCTVQGRTSQ